eukprot:TRINITY_DN36797_c0_g1_i1.p1 TRINITY_DN36797_c0_g1~~TRINITY_DN36797_c0_g1_i1.p1  ORF type:complete len:134 (-),score=21.75 TRINITY_DN36797_c0_g1_i1:84-485(-)
MKSQESLEKSKLHLNKFFKRISNNKKIDQFMATTKKLLKYPANKANIVSQVTMSQKFSFLRTDSMNEQKNQIIKKNTCVQEQMKNSIFQISHSKLHQEQQSCLLYTSDAADEEDSVDLGGRRTIKKKKSRTNI